MSKYNSLAMSSDLAKDARISVSKSFFGLCTKAVYTPTQSPLTARRREYSVEDGGRLARALKADKPAQQLAALGHIEEVGCGNYLLECCLSADHAFAALRLYRYEQLRYEPVTGICIFEKEEAATVASLF